MARTILTLILIVLLNVLAGCNELDSRKMQLRPPRDTGITESIEAQAASMSEADIAESVASTRLAYRNALRILLEHYNQSGDKMKLDWAKAELKALDQMPQYNYIVEASLAGPDLRAVDDIPAANYMYDEARILEKKAKELVLLRDDNLLRLALDKYNQLIRQYPRSDKIDDAAFRAAGIHEDFKDYAIAVLYYQRTYQWDPQTLYPAMFNAAYVLDRKLHQRQDALQLYQEAIKNEGLDYSYRNFAEMRIKEFTEPEQEIK